LADSSNNNYTHTLNIEAPFYIEQEFINKYNVLNYLVRNTSFVSYNDKIVTIPHEKLRLISLNTHIPITLVARIIRGFLINTILFRDHMNSYALSWGHKLEVKIEKVSNYLDRLFNLVPVFDLGRAKKNLVILYRLLELNCYWPCLTTQLALVLFVTDRNDMRNSGFIIQKNLRAICASSAYAFHRARNKLGIKNTGQL